jgi:hypothetical protein
MPIEACRSPSFTGGQTGNRQDDDQRLDCPRRKQIIYDISHHGAGRSGSKREAPHLLIETRPADLEFHLVAEQSKG